MATNEGDPPPTLPKTMKAWIVAKNGEPRQALTLRTDAPVPSSPKSGNLLVRVDYAALNPADLNFMGNLPSWLPFRRTPTPGLDFSGTVVRSAAPTVPVGAAVAGALNVVSVAIGRGTLAEYVEVPAAKVVALRPSGGGAVGARDAAGALGIAGQTAVAVVRAAEAAGLRPGARVLVNGASGGVGSVLVQAAKARGAVVYGVCSAGNAELVRRLGADEVRRRRCARGGASC